MDWGWDYNPVMIFGAHLLLMGHNPEAGGAFFRDVLEMPAVDATSRIRGKQLPFRPRPTTSRPPTRGGRFRQSD